MAPFLFQIITYAVIIWPFWYLITIIWDVYFSKLSKIPGPKLAAATRFVLIRHKARGDMEWWKRDLHRKYGPVVRVAPTEVSFANGDAWKEIYGFARGAKSETFIKDPAFYKQQGGPSIMVVPEPDHGRQRRSFSHAFSPRALQQHESLIEKHISQLVENLKAAADRNTADQDTNLDLGKQYNCAAFDIMADLAWGESLGCLKNSEYVPWIHMIFSVLKELAIVAELNYYPTLRKLLDYCIPASLKEKRKQHLKYSADRVDRRLAAETPRLDIWGFVLSAKEGHQLTLPEMHANAGFFMVAGSEPVGTILSGLTYFLLSNPSTMKILTSELRNAFNSAEEITIKGVAQLTYLNACIEEALRMYPPVPIGLPRVVPPGGKEICGYTIPQGISVYVHHLATYRNPANFSRPDDFLPQRWLNDSSSSVSQNNNSTKSPLKSSGEDFSGDDKSSLQPFIVGPRACLGSNLAYIEIRLILAHVLYGFDFELCDVSRNWSDQRVFTLWETKPLMVRCNVA